MNTRNDEYDPDDVITVDGVPGITVGQLADIALAQEAHYQASLAGLGEVGQLLAALNDPQREPRQVAPALGLGLTPVRKHGTAIGWTHWPATVGETIVSVTGCDPVSPGCDNCYSAVASSMPRLTRLEKYAGVAEAGKFTGLIKLHPLVLDKAIGMRKRRTFFHNSMSDTFHPKVPDGHIAYHLAIVAGTPQHNWIDLTKRPPRMRSLMRSAAFRDLVLANYRRRFGPSAPLFDWPLPNLALGVSVEDQERAEMRMPYLVDVADHAACVFVSAEPLLGAVDLTPWLTGPAKPKLWIIAGGESGAGHRPVDPSHVRSLRDQCAAARVPFYFKQWGGPKATSGGRQLDGLEHDGFPAMAYRAVA